MSRLLRKRFLTLALAVTLAGAALPGAAQNAGQNAAQNATKGRDLAVRAKAANDGFGSVSADGKMVLRDRSGTENTRQFSARTVEMADDGDRTEIVFNTPLDVRGLALLTHAHRVRDDDQWLYLPALTRVKRIASGSRSGSFAGSEFSYEDLVGHIIDKNDYLWLREEPCPGNPGRQCQVNQQTPKSADSGYSKLVGWLDTADFRTYKVDYYDRAGGLAKTLIASDFRLYKNKFWRAHSIVMTNHSNGKSTVMEWSRFDFDTPVRANELEPYAMGRR